MNTQTRVVNLEKTVNMSSVQAVNQAIQERDQANEKREEAEKASTKTSALLKRRSFLYSGLLNGLLFFLSVKNKVFVNDIIDFFKIPTQTLFHFVTVYFTWLHTPTYGKNEEIIAFSPELAWCLRIITPLLITVVFIIVIKFIISLIRFYRRRWCPLSLKAWVFSYGGVVIFGDKIQSILPINLLLLVLIFQVLYLIILLCMDTYYENRYLTLEWEQIQNR